MAKKRHNKAARIHKENVKVSSPDERQRSLQPGTDEYRTQQALRRLKEAYNGSEGHGQKEAEVTPPPPPPVKKDEPQKTMAHDVAVRKFLRRRSKERMSVRIKKDIDAALGSDTIVGDGVKIDNPFKIPGVRSMSEEIYDDGINEKSFAKNVIRDYESDIKEIINTDNDKDGDVDEDDISPAMHRLHNKYMR